MTALWKIIDAYAGLSRTCVPSCRWVGPWGGVRRWMAQKLHWILAAWLHDQEVCCGCHPATTSKISPIFWSQFPLTERRQAQKFTQLFWGPLGKSCRPYAKDFGLKCIRVPDTDPWGKETCCYLRGSAGTNGTPKDWPRKSQSLSPQDPKGRQKTDKQDLQDRACITHLACGCPLKTQLTTILAFI